MAHPGPDRVKSTRVQGAALCLALTLTSFSSTRASDFLIDSWDADRGLPAGSASSIVQTPDGYLWIGTYHGLARFHGVRPGAMAASPGVQYRPSSTRGKIV